MKLIFNIIIINETSIFVIDESMCVCNIKQIKNDRIFFLFPQRGNQSATLCDYDP